MKDNSVQDYIVLAVDDEPIVHSMISAIIESSDLPVSLAAAVSSGEDALRLLTDIKPDICLLDINMDGMNGLDLGRRIMELLDQKTRIIYLTAYNSFDYAQQAIRVGAIDYILKPLNRNDLINALAKAINTLQAERIARIERETIKEYVGAVISSVEPPAESRLAAVVRDIRKYIEDNYTEDINTASAAEQLNLSPGYLGTLFKSGSGLSFRAYLRAVRISKAKELLVDHSLNLSEIAQAVGYDDVNYFSQAFLAETGVRPGEYRGSGRRWVK